MRKNHDPLSMIAQLLYVPQPSAIDMARDREREKARQKKQTPEYKKQNRERMRAMRRKP